MPQTQTEPGGAGDDVMPPAPPAPPANGSGGSGGGRGGPEQTRRMLIYGVLGFLALTFLVLVAFGGPQQKLPPKPDMPDLHLKGLQYATDEVDKIDGWDDVVPYDSTGQNRAIRDRTQWQVCFQRPGPATKVADEGDPRLVVDGKDRRAAREVWLGAVKINEGCANLSDQDANSPDHGLVQRIYDLNKGLGPDSGNTTIPDLANYPAHMARLAFGERASIRVYKLPNGGDAQERVPTTLPELAEFAKDKLIAEFSIKTDDADDVGGGWTGWKVCPGRQQPQAATKWTGQVIYLGAVPVKEDCPAP